MNNKAFTLVELLATLAILSVIMLIAIPNVMSILEKNKNATYIEDAKKLATLGEYYFTSNDSLTIPNSGNKCVRINLSALDQTDLADAPNNGSYDTTKSYVVVKHNGTKYTYDVQLVEKYNGKEKGVPLTSYTSLTNEMAIRDSVKGSGFLNTTCPTTKS